MRADGCIAIYVIRIFFFLLQIKVYARIRTLDGCPFFCSCPQAMCRLILASDRQVRACEHETFMEFFLRVNCDR